MDKRDLKPYVAVAIDDSLSVHKPGTEPENARYVVYQCGFEPMVVAVFSGLGLELCEADAEDIALEYLEGINWFYDEPRSADYII